MPSRRNRTVSLPLSIGAGKWTQKQFKRGHKGGGRVSAAAPPPPPPRPSQPVISVLPMIVVPMSNNNSDNNHNFACEPISPKVVKSNCHTLETKAVEVQKDDVVKEKEQAKEGLSFQRFLSRKSSSDKIVGKEGKEGKAAEKVEKKAAAAVAAPAAVPLPIPTTQKDGVKEVVSTLDEPRRLTADRYVMGSSFIIKSDEHLIEKILMKMNSWHPEDASKKTRMYKESDMKIIIKEITLRVDKINSIFYMPLMSEILERVSNLVRRKFGQNGVLLLAMDLFKAFVEVGYGPNIPSSIEYLCAHHLDSMMLTMIKEDGSLTQESKRKKLIEHQAKKDKARFSVTPAVTTPNNSVTTASTTTTNATMVVMAV